MRKKRPLCALLAGVMAITMTATSAQAAYFSDTVGHEAQEAIEIFAELGILEGYGDDTFRPYGTITRGELCAILDRIFEYEESAVNTFTDLDENAWYAGYMLRANKAGVIKGDGNGKIRPLDPITRQEALVMLARAFGIGERSDLSIPYLEVGFIADWALGYMKALCVGGYLGDLYQDPQKLMTRGEVVTVADRILKDVGWEIVGKTYYDGELLPAGYAGIHPEEFITSNGRVYYVGDKFTPSYGIDVSAHQKQINWWDVAADGVDFAMIRLGYRGYSAGGLNVDAYFQSNITGAVAAGLKVGVYFFSQAVSVKEAEEEARFLLKTLAPYQNLITLPVVFDWEIIGNGTTARTDKVSGEMVTACAAAFCAVIEEAGYQPMIYYYDYIAEKRYDMNTLDQYPFWYCSYKAYPSQLRPIRMWQYTNSGRVDGVKGNVDWNICFWED